MIPILPETAPFSGEQRAWLNGFLSGVLGLATSVPPPAGLPGSAPAETEPVEDEPWHDMTLELPERMTMAEGRPLRQKLMAAMAQQDCGQCGYLCRTYSAALATGADTDANKCVPGGKPTSRQLKALLAEAKEAGTMETASAVEVVTRAATTHTERFHREAPFPARFLGSQTLTGFGAEKATQRVVISLEGSGLTYEPGDSLGVYPENDPELVRKVMGVFHADGEEAVSLSDGVIFSSHEAFQRRCDLMIPSDEVMSLLSKAAEDPEEADRLASLASGQRELAQEGIFDVYDLLMKHPSSRPSLDDFVSALGKLQPRLYSIASSPHTNPGLVELCVAVVRYQAGTRERRGVASTYFFDRLKKGGRVGVYFQRSHEFRLPKNRETPLIMVGPGTGIAPFRSFLEERKCAGATGKNWLFFGAQKQATDFLYKDELTAYQKEGLLTRLSLAFSRDQSAKIYVQNRMLEEKEELWKWIHDEGAHFYICGDGKRMAADVEEALVLIAAVEGSMSRDEAAAYVQRLAQEGRFLKDVY